MSFAMPIWFHLMLCLLNPSASGASSAGVASIHSKTHVIYMYLEFEDPKRVSGLE
jgi:hypothetical protein